jgi:hypothetical protein
LIDKSSQLSIQPVEMLRNNLMGLGGEGERKKEERRGEGRIMI